MITNSLLSEVGKNTKPYVWTKGATESMLRFDTNTLPFAPPCLNMFLDSQKEKCLINEYADPSLAKLKKLIARYEKVDSDCITVTNSGDEALDIVAKAFLDPGDRFIIQPPTYDMFAIQLLINRGQLVEVPLKSNTFQIDKDVLIRKAIEQKAKIVIICNPNNPTGSVTSNKVIEYVLKNTNCIVVVDETYREFCKLSAVSLLITYPRLVILRSMSKFAGLAGARVGYLLANRQNTLVFDALRLPMGVSYFSSKLAEYVLTYDRNWLKTQAKAIISERIRLSTQLTKLGLYVYPSRANFILVRIGPKASQICKTLRERNILLRDRSDKPYLEGCVRITIRCREDNDYLVATLSQIL